MEIRPFRPADLPALDVQPFQRAWCRRCAVPLTQAHGEALLEAGPAWTAVAADGRLLGVGGFHVVNPCYAVAWALLADRIGWAMTGISRAVIRQIDALGFRRIEALVPVGFEAGLDWADMLGFDLFGVQRSAAPDGSDLAVFEMVR